VGDSADRARQLGEGDDHAAEQQQHEVDAVERSEVELAAHPTGEGETDAGEGHRAQQHCADRGRPVGGAGRPAEQQ
jgi:hypothetical protein